jgi:hypothetical protein
LTRVKPSKKEHHHGVAVCRVQQHGFYISSRPTPVASAEGVGQGRCGWILQNNKNLPRKKLFSKLNDFILVFTSFQLSMPPK